MYGGLGSVGPSPEAQAAETEIARIKGEIARLKAEDASRQEQARAAARRQAATEAQAPERARAAEPSPSESLAQRRPPYVPGRSMRPVASSSYSGPTYVYKG